MTPGNGRRLVLIAALAVAFGALMAWIKGNTGDWHDAVGNVSATWLLLPFLAGAARVTRGPLGAALAGLAVTIAALAGFYVAESFVLNLGPHPWLVDLSLTMRASLFWLVRACVSGPVFGAIGFWWRERRSLVALGVIAGAFVLEPLAWYLQNRRMAGGSAYPVPGYPALWIGEIAIGVIGFAVLSRTRSQSAPEPS